MENNVITRFEINFNEATRIFNEGVGRQTFFELCTNLYGERYKLPTFVEHYVPAEDARNAIVMLGPSCSGKTTLAKEFIKSHPQFEYLSMDDCAAAEFIPEMLFLHTPEQLMNSNLGFGEFGKRIENGTNLVIDGLWTTFNSRAALINTLHDFNYKVCAFSLINVPAQTIINCIKGRARYLTAHTLCCKNFTSLASEDWVEIYRAQRRISLSEAERELENTVYFKGYYDKVFSDVGKEVKDTAIEPQYRAGVLFAAFDEVYMVNVE